MDINDPRIQELLNEGARKDIESAHFALLAGVDAVSLARELCKRGMTVHDAWLTVRFARQQIEAEKKQSA